MWSAVPHTLPARLFIPVGQSGRVALRAAGATAQERERPVGLPEEAVGHAVEKVLLQRHLAVPDLGFVLGHRPGSVSTARGNGSGSRHVVKLLGLEADAEPSLRLRPVPIVESHLAAFGEVDLVRDVLDGLPPISVRALVRQPVALPERGQQDLRAPPATVDEVADGPHEEPLSHPDGPLEVVGHARSVTVTLVPQIPATQGDALKEAGERPVVPFPPRIDRSAPSFRHGVPERLPVEVRGGGPVVLPRVIVAVTLRALERLLRHGAVATHAQLTHLDDAVSHLVHAMSSILSLRGDRRLVLAAKRQSSALRTF